MYLSSNNGRHGAVLVLLSALVGMSGAFTLSMVTPSSVSSTTLAGSRRSFLSTAATAAAVVAVPAGAVAEDDKYKDFVTTDSGLRYKVTKEGTGAVPTAGATVKTQYTGWIDDFDGEKKFDSSRDRNRPFSFKVGAGQVIRGWDESFGAMAIGERRQIIIPPRLGYGDRGAGGVIPGGATLYFDVELLGIL